MTAKLSGSVVLGALAVFLGAVGSSSHAQDGDILIGMSLPLSGFNAAAGQEGLATAKAAVAALNAAGGVQGRMLSLVALDDEFNPTKAAENAKTLDARGVVALFNCWGTASCSAIMPIVNERKVPLVTGISGGGPMRSDPGRYAFNMRPTTSDEIRRMVKQMKTLGQTKVALFYQDDAFGKSGQAASKAVFEQEQLTAVADIPLAPDGSNVPAAVKQLEGAGANAAIVVASPRATVALISQARKAGKTLQFYNLAAQANRKVVADLGPYTRGVVFSTLVPSPWRAGLPIVRDYQKVMSAATGKDDYSYLGLEVFINVQVLYEGLKKAGPKVTRESLVTALETMGEKRFGPGMSISYGPKDRNGSEFVGLAMISSDGRFLD